MPDEPLQYFHEPGMRRLTFPRPTRRQVGRALAATFLAGVIVVYAATATAGRGGRGFFPRTRSNAAPNRNG